MFTKTFVILREFQHFIAYENDRVNHYMLYQSIAYVLILSNKNKNKVTD